MQRSDFFDSHTLDVLLKCVSNRFCAFSFVFQSLLSLLVFFSLCLGRLCLLVLLLLKGAKLLILHQRSINLLLLEFLVEHADM